MKYRFHLLGLVHLPCSKDYMSCAFTQKNYKLAKMLLDLGYDVFYYGAEGSTVPCTEFIQTHTLKDIRSAWGDGDNRFEIGYDWTSGDFRHDFNTERTSVTLKFYKKCIREIKDRKWDSDFLLCTQGAYHNPVSDAVKLFLTCEPGIGYRGSVAGRFRAFESSYIQNFTYGSEAPYKCVDGSHYDRVIPNYFDSDDVRFSDTHDNYYLFMGRMIRRKGIVIAAEACNAIGAKLIIAGQGAHVDDRGYLVPNDNPDFELAPGTWEYVGYADLEKRKQLMAGAIATFVPTIYLECFAGVHIESMLHGAPPITTNFGVFPGTIPDCVDGEVGFKCNTLQDFVDAAQKAKGIDRKVVRQYGERFLTINVRQEFKRWFNELYHIFESINYKDVKAWHRLK